MWVYTQEEIEPRLRLKEGLAFWYDYWLFLHADETHCIWSCRPLGLLSLAGMSRDLHPRIDRALIRAITTELDNYHRLSGYFSIPPPTIRALTKRDGGFGIVAQWQEWLKLAGTPGMQSALIAALCSALAEAMMAPTLEKLLSFRDGCRPNCRTGYPLSARSCRGQGTASSPACHFQ